MSQKFGDFLFAHFSRMPFAMVDDEPLNPVDVSLLGADAVVLSADGVVNAVKETGFPRFVHSRLGPLFEEFPVDCWPVVPAPQSSTRPKDGLLSVV